MNSGSKAISLVGMSNIGKTFWSERLGDRGYLRICCDDLIARDLGPLLARERLSGSIEDVAKWMGLPHEERSARNQEQYLRLEDLAVWEAMESVGHGPAVIDTTGSVVHLESATREALCRTTTVVYLQTPPHLLNEMLQRFIAEPKPVVWGNLYAPVAGEAPSETLARCYPLLLAARNQLYESMAHIILGYEVHRAADFTVEEFLGLVS